MRRASVCLSWVALFVMLSACATGSPPNGSANYSMVDVPTARTLHERGALFVDVRTRYRFDEGHIPGAVNVAFNRFNDNTLARVASKDQEVVFYCYGMGCDYSNKASSRARAWGYQKVYYFAKGFPGWWDAGYPIEQ